MAPAYVANMAPPFVRYWKGWNRPISRRWLGSHKTVVGFGAGVLRAVLVTWLQARLVRQPGFHEGVVVIGGQRRLVAPHLLVHEEPPFDPCDGHGGGRARQDVALELPVELLALVAARLA